MGNCSKSTRNEPNDKAFTKSISLEIQVKDYKEQVKFLLTDPIKVDSFLHSSPDFSLKITQCVIPGLDPRGLIHKTCQDTVFVTLKNSSLLAGIFDGHGKYGKEVVDFCSFFMQEYFKSHDFEESIKESLSSMIEDCDKALLTDSKINCSTSGTTCVILLINSDEVWTCSVGDSRAILATQPKHPKLPKLDKINSEKTSTLKPVQITLDQKPNIAHELERIKKHGGVVSQITNSEGQKIGPYRIWKENSQIPGLAMSRSLGDTIAKKLGVIPNGILYNLKICSLRDQFIVLATDGIWDVMGNEAVCSFIEKYRSICPQKSALNKKKSSESNSCIAEFVCEEARHQWFDVCRKEDVAIDDISVIVIEFLMKDHFKTGVLPRKPISSEHLVEPVSQAEILISERFDARRGSNAVIGEEEKES